MANLVPAPTRTARRARAIAMGTGAEHLVFRLAGESYALPLGVVKEILVVPVVTRVPRAPVHVLGIISVRGQLVTVMDLGTRIDPRLPAGGHQHDIKARVLLVRGPADEVIGLLVDEVDNVSRFAESDVEPPESLGGSLGEHVTGIARRDGEVVVVLSLAALLGGTA